MNTNLNFLKTLVGFIALIATTQLHAQTTQNHTSNNQWWISGGAGKHQTSAHLLLQNAAEKYWALFNDGGDLRLNKKGNDSKMFKMNTNVGVNGKLFVNGNLHVENIVGKRSIYTWYRDDENWRIGMNESPGFERAITTSHVQYITYFDNPGQGFALGVNGEGKQSSFEISGDDHQAYFRGNVGIGITDPTEKLVVGGTIKADNFVKNDGTPLFTPPKQQWTEIGGNLVPLNTTKALDVGRLFIDGQELTIGDDNVINVNPLWNQQAGTDGDIYYNNGSVGIGTANPDSTVKLDVNGGVKIDLNLTLNNGFVDNAAGISGSEVLGSLSLANSPTADPAIEILEHGVKLHTDVEIFGNLYGSQGKGIHMYGDKNLNDASLTVLPSGDVTVINLTSANEIDALSVNASQYLLNDEPINFSNFSPWNNSPSDNGDIFYNNGNVGIGTTSPLEKLGVSGNISLDGGALLFDRIESPTLSYINSSIDYSWQDNALDIKASRSGDIRFFTNTGAAGGLSGRIDRRATIESMRITPDGNVGIGTTEPEYKLDVNGVINATELRGNNVVVEDGGSVYGGQNGLKFFVNEDFTDPEDYSMWISTNGNVNVNPNFNLSVDDILSSGTIETTSLILSDREHSDKISGTRLHVDGRAYISEDDTLYPDDNDTEKGFVDMVSENYANYLLWVEKGVATLDIALVALNYWPDDVFNKDYELRSLKDLESQIKEKGHLPNMPSGKQIEKNGFTVKDMTIRTVKTVEELTLYTIEQQKQIDSQKELIQKLMLRLEVLESSKK